MSAQAFGQFTLGHPGSDPQRDEHLPESMEVQNLSDLTATEPFVAGHLFRQLLVERAQRIDGPLDFGGRQAGFAQSRPSSRTWTGWEPT